MGLRDILDAATPGPWVADETLSNPGELHNVWRTSGTGLRAVAHDITEFPDARLIALAPELAALCLDMGEALTTLNTMAAHSDAATGFLIESGIELNALLARLDQLGKEQTDG